ncbi:hypothetical protein AM587_10014510 [Phytophthora nicotianae]|nr:hypothetical protein AM587_10014510 [Phytophthora nicotianae]
MEKLFTKIGSPSYLPTPAEVLDGVRWLRENPAIAAGVVVGLTSYSVAKYYQYDEDSDEENDDNPANGRATQDEIARSVTALHLGLLKIDTKKDLRHSAAASSASTESSLGSSGGLRSRASSVFDKTHHELQQQLYHQEDRKEDAMTYYRFGQRLKMTRAVARAMARSSAGKQNSATIEKLVQTSKNRFGSAVARPLGAALATFLDSGVAFNTSSEFLYFDGEDDDGTTQTIGRRRRSKGRSRARETTMTDTTELRVSENFPRVPKPCEKVATKFFACFYEHGKQPKGESDPEAGNVALDKCKDALLAYNTCVDTELAKNPKQLFRVPEAYRTRE